MGFLQVVDEVKDQLSVLSIQEKAKLFKDVLKYPILIEDGVYSIFNRSYDLNELSDYLKIREHWMSMNEFDKLFDYFTKLSKK